MRYYILIREGDKGLCGWFRGNLREDLTEKSIFEFKPESNERGSHEVSEEHFQQKEQQVQKPKTGMDLTVFAWY